MQDLQNSDAYKVGDRVSHPSFGKGVVTATEKAMKPEESDRVQVRFDSAVSKWLVLEYARLALLDADDAELMPAVGEAPWPDATFVFEQDEGAHFLGAHWKPFFDDSKELFCRLPEILPQTLVQTSFGNSRTPPHQLPAGWPKGYHSCWPLRVRGLGMTQRINDEQQVIEMVSLYPFWVEGSQARLTVKQVRVWAGGCEAQITAGWGDAEVSFFDTQFMANRLWYEVDRAGEFVLTGIAYSALPAPSHTTTVKHTPETLAKINALLMQNGGEPIEAEQEVTFDGAAIFLPIDAWDVDDYSFRAPIKEVHEFEDFLGQKGWCVKATVLRHFGDASDDGDLKIVITQRAWQGDEPPKVGQDIEGHLWLQGWMCYL